MTASITLRTVALYHRTMDLSRAHGKIAGFLYGIPLFGSLYLPDHTPVTFMEKAGAGRLFPPLRSALSGVTRMEKA